MRKFIVKCLSFGLLVLSIATALDYMISMGLRRTDCYRYQVFNDIFKKYTSKAELTQSKTMNMGSLYKLTYDVTIKKGVKEKEFLDEIRVKNCNLKVLLSHPYLEEEI